MTSSRTDWAAAPRPAYQTGTCRSCNAVVFWASTTGGRVMPVDVDPVPGGNVCLDGPTTGKPVATVVTKAEAQSRNDLHRSHFTTCPQRDAWRTRGRR